jgi:hypothetical protein
MKINDVVWLAQFVEKIEKKHGVSPDQVEEVFDNGPRFQRIEEGYCRRREPVSRNRPN